MSKDPGKAKSPTAKSRPLSSAESLADAGQAFASQKKWAEAIAAYERSLALNPRQGLTCGALAYCYEKSERFSEAIDAYQRAVALMPDSLALTFNLGNVLRTEGKLKESEEAYRRALALEPTHVLTWNNLGLTLHALGRYDEAISCYARALEIRPEYADAINNLGTAYVARNDLPTAIEAYQAALLLEPARERIRFNEGVAHLLAGNLESGFRGFEYRELPPYLKALNGAPWNGRDSVEGKSVLIAFEQGYGDTIHFVRYAKLVARRGARVHLLVQPNMKRLFASVAGVATVVAAGDPLPPYDTHVSMMSLPHVLGTKLDSIPSETPYLSAPTELLAQWKERVHGPRPRIGLAWSGNLKHHLDRWRSIPVERLMAACDGLPVHLVSLQKEVRQADAEYLLSSQALEYFGEKIEDFADTAALIAQLDLVVSVDTSVAHLAGALGKPVWILIPHAPDFRWMLNRPDSPWYPSARLFRQKGHGDWAPVLQSLRDALQAWLKAGNSD